MRHPRSRPRRSRPRNRTLASRALRKVVAAARAEADAGLTPHEEAQRPRTRGECREGIRPCPWVGCKYHMYLDVNPETGTLKLNFPDLEPWDLAESCTLDIAERGGATLEEVGGLMNIVRERVRQIEVGALVGLAGRLRAR